MDQSSLTEKICSNGFFMFRLSAQVGGVTALKFKPFIETMTKAQFSCLKMFYALRVVDNAE